MTRTRSTPGRTYSIQLHVHPNNVGSVMVLRRGHIIENSNALPLAEARELGNMWYDLYRLEDPA